jgi:hypothetical protein
MTYFDTFFYVLRGVLKMVIRNILCVLAGVALFTLPCRGGIENPKDALEWIQKFQALPQISSKQKAGLEACHAFIKNVCVPFADQINKNPSPEDVIYNERYPKPAAYINLCGDRHDISNKNRKLIQNLNLKFTKKLSPQRQKSIFKRLSPLTHTIKMMNKTLPQFENLKLI